MKRIRKRLRETLRIVSAIALKDAADAIKNKTIQGLMISVLMTMLTGRALPLLLGLSNLHGIVIYDEDSSDLVANLGKREGVRLRRVTSQHSLEEMLGIAGDVSLGLVLPPDLDQALKDGHPPVLGGYLAHWASQDDATELKEFFEGQLAELAGQPVHISISEERIYPKPDAEGFPGMAAGTIALVIIIVGILLVPYLLIDEKQAKTIDALLVSPASLHQVVIGKTIAGTFYCLAATGLVLAFNHSMVVNWGLAILATLCGIFFAVAVGLLLGSVFDLPQQMAIVGGGLLMILIVPMFLSDFSSTWPPFLRALLPWLPSIALGTVLRISFSNVVPVGQILPNLAIMLGSAVAVLAMVVWKVRQVDR